MVKALGNPRQFRWMLLLALLVSVFAVPIHSQATKADSTSEAKPPANPSPQESMQPPAVEPKEENSPPASPEQLRQTQIEADTKKLYQLSAELRAEVAKTYKESLSLTVLKKAEEVEKLAKSLKVLMSREAASKP
jgi:hypothetical protein